MSGSGYRRPPKDTRFKKGQSGNPKGRPKTVGAVPSSASKLVLDAAERMISVREGEAVREISVIEAMIRAQQSAALKGSPLAQKHAIDTYERAAGQHRAAIEAENERWRQNVDKLRFLYAEATRKGRSTQLPLPHPDDVVIDLERGVSFIGPISEEEEVTLKEALELRDLLVFQDALDERLNAGGGDAHLDRSGTGLVAAQLINDRVPNRFRLSAAQITLRMMRARTMTKRELLTTVYLGWKALGAKPTRGQTLPPPRALAQAINKLVIAMNEQESR